MLRLELGEGLARELDLVETQVGHAEQEEHLGVHADARVAVVGRTEAIDGRTRTIAIQVELGDVQLVLEQLAVDDVEQLFRFGAEHRRGVVVEEVQELDLGASHQALIALVVRRQDEEALRRGHVGGGRGHVAHPAIADVLVGGVELGELLERVLRRDVVALRELGARDEQLGLDGVAREGKADPDEVGVGDGFFPVAVGELGDRELVVLAGGRAVVGGEIGTVGAPGGGPQGEGENQAEARECGVRESPALAVLRALPSLRAREVRHERTGR